ncbi:hypothetical protein ZOSMA_176G00280 [Zostera marina]|uniref:Uncharacterized protein n=1 Tax=Zostera marina TaxID=29655 RepID=A0A0K9PS28_ZOSMR|nr:hypothetical protein ZOSMA_176G00280 [Zostera marina]
MHWSEKYWRSLYLVGNSLILTSTTISLKEPFRDGSETYIRWARSIKLSSNKFSRHIPSELFNCSSLLVMSLDDNLLDSTLPSEMGGLRSINRLNLSHNRLSNAISPSIGKLRNLYELDLSQNFFSGNIPF